MSEQYGSIRVDDFNLAPGPMQTGEGGWTCGPFVPLGLASMSENPLTWLAGGLR